MQLELGAGVGGEKASKGDELTFEAARMAEATGGERRVAELPGKPLLVRARTAPLLTLHRVTASG